MLDGDAAVGSLVRFARALRAAGIAVGPGATEMFCTACARLGPSSIEDVYWAGRACLVDRVGDVPTYEAVFNHMFLGGRVARRLSAQSEALDPSLSGPVGKSPDPATAELEAVPDDMDDPDRNDGMVDGTGSSYDESLRSRSFEHLTAAERHVVEDLIAELRLRTPTRRSRRTTPAARGDVIDLRRSLRAALRTDGEIIRPARRARRRHTRRLIFLLDVSRSMAMYSRALVLLAYAAARSDVPLEAYCFGTRLTRITEELTSRDPQQALVAAGREVPDWDGGTRIGEALMNFRKEGGSAGLARGAIVVVCSDGLERSAVEVLASEAARLSRLAYRLVWVNPLSGDPRYAPRARGMAAVMPYLDHFVSGHNLASLEALTDLLSTMSDHGRWSSRGGYTVEGLTGIHDGPLGAHDANGAP